MVERRPSSACDGDTFLDHVSWFLVLVVSSPVCFDHPSDLDWTFFPNKPEFDRVQSRFRPGSVLLLDPLFSREDVPGSVQGLHQGGARPSSGRAPLGQANLPHSDCSGTEQERPQPPPPGGHKNRRKYPPHNDYVSECSCPDPTPQERTTRHNQRTLPGRGSQEKLGVQVLVDQSGRPETTDVSLRCLHWCCGINKERGRCSLRKNPAAKVPSSFTRGFPPQKKAIIGVLQS